MRRLSSATRLVLALLVGAGKVASTEFYFDTGVSGDWAQLFNTHGYKIGPADVLPAIDSTEGNATSIVNFSSVSQSSMRFDFGRPATSTSFQTAILVDVDSKKTLAVGYDNDNQGKENPDIDLPQFPRKSSPRVWSLGARWVRYARAAY